jgi:hypothetical protein
MGQFSETERVDPLGSEVEELLAETEPAVTPQQLLEIVTETLEKSLPGDLHGKARQNVLAFLVETEYRHSVKTHVGRAVRMRMAGRWKENDPYDNSDRVDVLIGAFGAMTGSEEPVAINQPIGPGGLTSLHMAAMDGEMDVVKKLVEKDRADVNVRDNLKKTPYDRARAFGHHAVAEYLLARMDKSEK